MSNTQQAFQSGKAHGEGGAKAEEWMQSAKDTVTGGASNTARCAQENKEQAAGFLQQTGEQVKQMAQKSTDAVKNAIGMDTTATATEHEF